MEKLFIKNRLNKNLALTLKKNNKQTGLAFIMPGLAATKEDSYVHTFMDSFFSKGFTVISFDVTNGVGESDGDYSQASFTGYYNDLEDVIAWSRKQDWWQEPFILAGHSMGGGCILHYAANYPENVLGVAPISTVIGGSQTIAKFGRNDLPAVKIANGQEIIKKLDWEPFRQDILQYDIVSRGHLLTMPVLMVVGENDLGTPLEDQRKLYDQLPGPKEIHTIKGAPHTFEEVEHLTEIKQIFHNWLDKEILK